MTDTNKCNLSGNDIKLVTDYLEALRDEGWNGEIRGFLTYQIEKLENGESPYTSEEM